MKQSIFTLIVFLLLPTQVFAEDTQASEQSSAAPTQSATQTTDNTNPPAAPQDTPPEADIVTYCREHTC